ncbi:ABC transporter ATP-binding protein [Pyramidobacter sp. C12-8]|uniref:ABC transporter ATP-binding protein n=1 Tax=Pyramidobacter sp. C12-8 TaxID=1943580 RepID=UPI00098FEFBC|nr:ABC transporter ATP-binding protein [Pyramidobacter sp. C12-8]OON87317.1 peptide ABC transporter ATP-binding protein [Pyramidobacter sp. C12-8]
MTAKRWKAREPFLQIRGLKVKFPERGRELVAVDGVDLSIARGEIAGVAGESGSGKSVMSQSILRLGAYDSTQSCEGEILFAGQDLLRLPEAEMRRLRGSRIAVIFQDPMTSLSPVHTVARQMTEVLTLHRGCLKIEARRRCAELLARTGIAAPEACLRKYPFELSGGMQQRVMIAMALCCEPELLIADEPTTALDATVQQQILELLAGLNRELGMSMLFISHNLGAIAQLCHSVHVMYLGQILEEAPAAELFSRPLNPYTRGLLQCAPHLDSRRGGPLPTIAGTVPSPYRAPAGCRFCTRCPEADERCRSAEPPMLEPAPGHRVKCWKYAVSERNCL